MSKYIFLFLLVASTAFAQGTYVTDNNITITFTPGPFSPGTCGIATVNDTIEYRYCEYSYGTVTRYEVPGLAVFVDFNGVLYTYKDYGINLIKL